MIEITNDDGFRHEDMILAAEEEVAEFNSEVYSITIETRLLYPHLTRCLEALRDIVFEVLGEVTELPIRLTRIDLDGLGPLHSLEQGDWEALSAIISTVSVSSELGCYVVISYDCCSSAAALFPSFILALRQHAFALYLVFLPDLDGIEDPDDLLPILIEQQHRPGQTLSPPICPFAIRQLSFISIQAYHISLLVHLGRFGPEWVKLSDGSVFGQGNWESLDALMALLGQNQWLEWSNSHYTVSPGWISGSCRFEEDRVYEDELAKRICALNERNRLLRRTTQSAAYALRQAARSLLFSSPVASNTSPKHDAQTHSSLELISLSGVDPQPTLDSSAPISSSNTSTKSSISLLSLPYEILDMILSQLSPGCLSTNQYRLVMRYAEDRSTLAVERADTQIGFLRETNCCRWESEIERVNLGYGYE